MLVITVLQNDADNWRSVQEHRQTQHCPQQLAIAVKFPFCPSTIIALKLAPLLVTRFSV